MRRFDFDYLVILALILSGLYVFITGLLADLMGLNRFAYHPWAGYVFMALTLCHLALNWQRVKRYLRYRLRTTLELPEKGETTQAGSGLTRRDLVFTALGAAGGFGLSRFFQSKAGDSELNGRDLGRLFHRWSSFGRTVLPGGTIEWGSRPAQYKAYPEAPRVGLPDPSWDGELTLGKAIQRRRSIRQYRDQALSNQDLSRLLHAMQGVTESRRSFRASPSAGALYPIEVYAVVRDVEDVEQGVYHYAVREHTLERIKSGDFSRRVMAAGAMQTFIGEAQVCFVLSAIFQRTRWRYRERAYRYILLEAGHIAQNLYLAAAALGLGCCAVGAFRDQALDEVVGMGGDEGEASLYLLPVGQVT